MSLGKVSINLVVIKTNKIQEQFEFYSAIGVQFEYHKHGNGPYHYASVGVNPVIEIYPLPSGALQPDNTTRLGFAVEDLDQVILSLKEKGRTVISEPARGEWDYSAIILDIDGRKIELTQREATS